MDWNVVVTLSAVVLTVHSNGNESRLQCSDWQGKFVSDGTKFFPSNDFCYECTCLRGYPTMCTSVQCSPPDCSLYETIEGTCCKFHCIEVPIHGDTKNKSAYIPNYPGRGVDEDTANLGLRLVASTVTSFLILALLLFMVHRLRQRRMLIMMRRLNAERAEDDNVAYMAQFDQLDMGLDFTPYDDPPPPYSPPKPPRVPMGEAPPPYEEAFQTPGNNNMGEPVREGGGENSPPSAGENGQVSGTDDAVEATMPQDDRSEAGVPPSNRTSSQTSGAVDESSVDDVRCPDYRVAMVTNESPESSPSQMVVRMHNNIPHASLVESSRVSPQDDTQTPLNLTSPTQAQFAPQSSTASPRDMPHKRRDGRSVIDNSVSCCIGHDSPDSGRSTDRRRSSLHNSPESADEERDIHPAVYLSGRRRDTASCHGNVSYGNGRGGNRRSLGVQVFSVREIKDAAKSLRSRHSLPPTDLVLPERNQAETCAADSATCSRTAQLDGVRETRGSYPSEGACGGAEVPVSSPSRLWSPPGGTSCPNGGTLNQPVVISPFSPSPDSPVRQSPVVVRSSSVMSQFSVCSETGERRQYGAPSTGWTVPFADAHNYDNHPGARYESTNLSECRSGGSRGESPLRQECPEDNSVDNRCERQWTRQSGAGRRNSNGEVDPRISRWARLDDYARVSNEPRSHEGNNTNNARVGSDTGSHDSGLVRAKVMPAAAQTAKVMPLTRVIYRDSYSLGNDTDSGNAASVSSLPTCDAIPVVTRSPSGGSPSRGVDVNRWAKRLSSGAACSPRAVNETSPDHGFQHEKTTLQQLKKKRRPHSTPGHPVDLARTNKDLDNSQVHDKNKNFTASPGRVGGHRRTAKDQPDNSSTYKEYGFIDTPESSMLHLANADLPESVSKYLILCKSQADGMMNTNGHRGNVMNHSRENSRERNQKKRDGSGSRLKKRRSRPLTAFDALDMGDVSMVRHNDVSCSPTRHKHNARHYPN